MEPLTNDTVTYLGLFALLAICALAWNIRWAVEQPDRDDADDLAERIEAAVKSATCDLLDALNEANATLDRIAESNAYLEESEREFNQREGHADEAPGTSIHQMFVDEVAPERWAQFPSRPRGFRPDVVVVDDTESKPFE